MRDQHSAVFAQNGTTPERGNPGNRTVVVLSPRPAVFAPFPERLQTQAGLFMRNLNDNTDSAASEKDLSICAR